MKFRLDSSYTPSGDQPEAIEQLCSALREGVDAVTLLGVTGSGKTFTMANVIQNLQRPALILSHNKTLAAQLYGEFKSFFPDNAVEYFVSYYDYYQPEAYIPSSDTYIEKDLSINDQIEKLRLSTASSLLSGRRDVIVISSVSCLYGIGNPEDFHAQTVEVKRGERRSLTGLLYRLVEALYNRTEAEFKRGTFRVRGDTVDVYLGGADQAVRFQPTRRGTACAALLLLAPSSPPPTALPEARNKRIQLEPPNCPGKAHDIGANQITRINKLQETEK